MNEIAENKDKLCKILLSLLVDIENENQPKSIIQHPHYINNQKNTEKSKENGNGFNKLKEYTQ